MNKCKKKASKLDELRALGDAEVGENTVEVHFGDYYLLTFESGFQVQTTLPWDSLCTF